ncbi:unnamed protein product [Microthlaspi erraticum]|uniref:Uncharacterized protein n=1 Tax=Microthlaspi erraticum TaxID=1685480 RepID=A0A6D2IAG7_9BRAS|nr:unnamed protein product [Microthlaspi erraticum]
MGMPSDFGVSPKGLRTEGRNRAVSSSHEPEKTLISSSYTKSSGLVITRAREDTDLVIIYEIERSRHHTSPRRHRSRHHIRNRAVSSSHEPEKTPISSSYTKSSGSPLHSPWPREMDRIGFLQIYLGQLRFSLTASIFYPAFIILKWFLLCSFWFGMTLL